MNILWSILLLIFGLMLGLTALIMAAAAIRCADRGKNGPALAGIVMTLFMFAAANIIVIISVARWPS